MPNIGYCCINLSLQKKKIMYARDMIKKTFDVRGVAYASELALANTVDFIKVLQWNADNNVTVFRMGSGIFPWANHYKLTDMPHYNQIVANLARAGNLAKQTGQRITAHPDHFVKLGSARSDVVDNSLAELELQSTIFDLMGLPTSPHAAINIHVGMNFSEDTAKRWCSAALRLSPNALSRLVVENDDKNTGFSVVQLVTYIHSKLGTPVTFDYFHHEFHPDGLDTETAFDMAYATWPDGVTPLFHYSESKAINESVNCNPRAHADYVFSRINDYGVPLDIDLEAKMKDIALFKYRELHGSV
jgi:UV DNA damage endonuclease